MNADNRRTVRMALRTVFWLGLYGAFVRAAFALRARLTVSGAAEIWGFDYGTFVGQIQDWDWIAFFGFRHPGLGLVMSPLVAMEHIWSDAYLFVMPMVACATGFLLWHLIRTLSGTVAAYGAVALWLAMPYTWLLASVPESFPVAQLVLVASALFSIRNVGASRSSLVGAFGCALLNGLVTLTNGIKPLLVWFFLKASRRERWLCAAVCVAVVVLGMSFFTIRAAVTGRPVGDGIMNTLAWIPANRQPVFELVGFFIRPLGWAALAVWPFAVTGIVGLWRDKGTRKVVLVLLGLFVAPDFVLHLVVGWGMLEPWLFFAHWGWALVVLCGVGIGAVMECVGILRVRGRPAERARVS